MRQKDSPSGDKCHYDITGLTDKDAKDFFKAYNARFELFNVCIGNRSRPLTKQDMNEFALESDDRQVD